MPVRRSKHRRADTRGKVVLESMVAGADDQSDIENTVVLETD